MPDLRISDLTVEFSSGGFAIRPIDELTLSFEAGSLVLLLGPSGCGKTSLLSCLGTVLTPTSGSITFGDIDVTALSGAGTQRLPAPHRGHRVPGVQPRFRACRPWRMSPCPCAAAGYRWAEANARATELLEQVSLGDRIHHRPGDLSGGQQQRVALARALALDPPLILADEPTAHLDYIQVETLLTIMRELASGERIVVVATHDHRLVPLADQVIELVPELGGTDKPPLEVPLSPGEVLFRQGSWAIASTSSKRARSRSSASMPMGTKRYWPSWARVTTSGRWARCSTCLERPRRGPAPTPAWRATPCVTSAAAWAPTRRDGPR